MLRVCATDPFYLSKAEGILQGAFHGWPDILDNQSSSVGVRIAILAQMLTIFDLDDDGIAA